MTRAPIRRSIWAAIGLAVIALLVRALRPEPLLVEVAAVTRGTVRSIVSSEGRTRVKALYTVTAPVDGELDRIVFDPGAELNAESVVARIRPIAPRPLDARSRAEAAAAVVAAREGLARAEAAEREAEVGVEHVQSQFARTQKLAESGSTPQADVEHGGHQVLMAQRGLEAAQALVRQARADLARATAVIAPLSENGAVAVVEVKSPVKGQVLRVLRESGGPVATGTPLVEMGDVRDAEIVADLLSSDAALVRPGALATVSGWGGAPLSAMVRRVDPAGFTKVSALGLEEQRVRTVLDLKEPPPQGLGHDYRVDVAIAVWEGKDVLRLPSTALFRSADKWATFAIRDGRARLIQVETGPSDETSTVITRGLAAGEKVILQPSDAIQDGTRVGILREVSAQPG
ncbi:MAG TPA: HlyD family efflux transporter periplasmic adaptor subunit [Polyangiaceae bacterium]|nr:HlyD family efflux transporter periplasmic adaptor subunit [Polyangiaceae bacterium]